MNREKLIYLLTKYELKWFLENGNDSQQLWGLSDFFAKGGFAEWSDENLQKKYDLFLAEENQP